MRTKLLYLLVLFQISFRYQNTVTHGGFVLRPNVAPDPLDLFFPRPPPPTEILCLLIRRV